MSRESSRTTLFPYTTLFRSQREEAPAVDGFSAAWSRLRAGRTLAVPLYQALDPAPEADPRALAARSEEHTSELQSHVISYAVFCLKKKIFIFDRTYFSASLV